MSTLAGTMSSWDPQPGITDLSEGRYPWSFAQSLIKAATGTVKTFTPGVAGKIQSIQGDIFLAGVGANADISIKVQIDGVDVTGGVCALLVAGAGVNAVLTWSAITALNTFTATSVITLVMTVTTAFTAGIANITLVMSGIQGTAATTALRTVGIIRS